MSIRPSQSIPSLWSGCMSDLPRDALTRLGYAALLRAGAFVTRRWSRDMCTRDLNRLMRLNQRFEYRMVGVNTASFSDSAVQFGGWKQSGLGREGSPHRVDDYMELKHVCFGNLAR
jgi:Aldehyde dehydrogenase family